MQHEVVRTKIEATLKFAAQAGDSFAVKIFSDAGHVDEVVGMNDQRLQVILLAQPVHGFALRAAQLIRLPLTRTRGENLKRAAAETIGALSGGFHTACSRRVNADAARGAPGRLRG